MCVGFRAFSCWSESYLFKMEFKYGAHYMQAIYETRCRQRPFSLAFLLLPLTNEANYKFIICSFSFFISLFLLVSTYLYNIHGGFFAAFPAEKKKENIWLIIFKSVCNNSKWYANQQIPRQLSVCPADKKHDQAQLISR